MEIMIKKDLVTSFIRKNKFYLIVIFLSMALTIVWNRESHQVNNDKEQNNMDIATFIPSGFVLVPIEIQNYESVNSILGSYGVVDLFSPPLDQRHKVIKLASHVKIIRAPLNPKQFAVIAPEHKAPDLVKAQGPLFVVVQNPHQKGTKFIKQISSFRRKIIVENIGSQNDEDH